jgi:predicted nucleic acid-binding protein
MYLVDTNVISGARRRTPQAVAWLRRVNPVHVYLSVITLGEIMRGEIMRGIALKQRNDPQAARHLNEGLHLLRLDRRPHPADHRPDRRGMGSPRCPAPTRDAGGLIAATARVQDLILVTRKVADFEDTATSVLDAWRL